MVLDDGNIELPIKFTADKSGHYPCRIVLEAPDDIRVYQVECTVNPPGCRWVERGSPLPPLPLSRVHYPMVMKCLVFLYIEFRYTHILYKPLANILRLY